MLCIATDHFVCPCGIRLGTQVEAVHDHVRQLITIYATSYQSGGTGICGMVPKYGEITCAASLIITHTLGQVSKECNLLVPGDSTHTYTWSSAQLVGREE